MEFYNNCLILLTPNSLPGFQYVENKLSPNGTSLTKKPFYCVCFNTSYLTPRSLPQLLLPSFRLTLMERHQFTSVLHLYHDSYRPPINCLHFLQILRLKYSKLSNLNHHGNQSILNVPFSCYIVNVRLTNFYTVHDRN